MDLKAEITRYRRNICQSIPSEVAITIAIGEALRKHFSRPAFDGPHSTLIISVCQYCGTHIGAKNGWGAAGGPSHGICPQCMEKIQ